MIIEIILFILGLILLVEGADFLVKAASSAAKRLGVSEFIIGLTVISIGTSVPELASSVTASLVKDSGLIMGNIVGANIANIGLIIGLAAFLYNIKTNSLMLKRDGYIMIFTVLLFYIFILDMSISRVEALVFLFFYMVYILFLVEKKPSEHIKDFIYYFFRFQYLTTIKSKVVHLNHEKVKQKKKVKKIFEIGLLKDFSIIVVACAAVILGAHYVVREAEFFAGFLNVPTNVIGISLVALGTTLPELMVTLAAVRKGFSDVAIGNIIGSNIANIFLILGIAGLINPLKILKPTVYFVVPFMVFIYLLFLVFLRTEWKIRRWEGVALFFLYIMVVLAVLSGIVY